MKKNWLIIAIIFGSFILRAVNLDKYPSGLNADEAALGYNAYSLIQTGKDEHGIAWPLVFRSFDDYKPPFYVYVTIPFVKLFGLNIWSVRLPSALAGVISVYLLYLLVKEIFKDKKYLPELSALLLTISPWHIHFSRGAWEVNLSTMLILFGVYMFLKSLSNKFYFYFFVAAFVLSLYTYHSARIIAPLIAISLFLNYFKDLFQKKNTKTLTICILMGIIFALPVAFQLFSKEGQSRFSGVSIFSDRGPLSWVEEMRRTNSEPNSIFTKIKYNKYSAYAAKFVNNYFLHFSPNFLFINGDKIDRSRVPGYGQLLPILLPFVLIGFIYLILHNKRESLIVLSWLFFSPVAASLTYQSPHALRAENMIIPLIVITSVGVYQFLFYFKKWKSVLVYAGLIILIGLIYQFSGYLYSYFYRYQRELPTAWQYGFSELVSYLNNNSDKYKKIIISTRYDQPYILMAFFEKYPAEKLQEELVMSKRDNYGFSTGTSFNKYEFKKIEITKDINQTNTLLVIADEPINDEIPIKVIKSIGGQEIFKLIESHDK